MNDDKACVDILLRFGADPKTLVSTPIQIILRIVWQDWFFAAEWFDQIEFYAQRSQERSVCSSRGTWHNPEKCFNSFLNNKHLEKNDDKYTKWWTNCTKGKNWNIIIYLFKCNSTWSLYHIDKNRQDRGDHCGLYRMSIVIPFQFPNIEKEGYMSKHSCQNRGL